MIQLTLGFCFGVILTLTCWFVWAFDATFVLAGG